MNKANEWVKYKNSEHQGFVSIPCGYYDIVDIEYISGSKKNRVRAGDFLRIDNEISRWRLSEIQSVPKNDSHDGGGYWVDNTAPSSAELAGYDDDDFDPRYM